MAGSPLPPNPAPQPPPVPQTTPAHWKPGPRTGFRTRWGQCDAAGPGWNKVLRPGAGLLPAPGAPRAGSLQTQSEPGSKRESERAGEFDESSAQPPPESLGSLGSVTYLSGPAAQCGLRPVSPHGAWGSLGSQPGPAVTRRDCPCAPRRSEAIFPALNAARLSPSGASHFVGWLGSLRLPIFLPRAPATLLSSLRLRGSGTPASPPPAQPWFRPGLLPAAPRPPAPRPDRVLGGSVPAAGGTVRPAGAAGSGLRGAATEPRLRVAASERLAGGAHRAEDRRGGGKEGARRATGRRERTKERRREGRLTSSATIIRLKQVQPLFPPPGGQRRAEEDHVDQTLGKEKWERWATDLPKQIGRRGSHGLGTQPMGRFINSGLSQEPGGTAKSCWHTVHWFRAGCAWRWEWSGGPPSPEPASGAGSALPPSDSPLCGGWGWGGSFWAL